ncbi:MAG: UPF0182 family protein [Ignavibacteria bacterium]|jgi:uncharacterized membrane protein (UPF0182 family)|nr:UPF0182 family protein [Ignavibacteria bacterium]MCU7524944.1 UPF0182 family protein [Ignavibacteria bacterium]
MYNALFIALLLIAAFLFFTGAKRQEKGRMLLGAVIAALTIFFFWFMDFWGEALWYESLGYGDRFWIINSSNIGFGVLGAILGYILIYVLMLSIPRRNKAVHIAARVLGLVMGGLWGYSNWEVILKFFNRVDTGIHEPILGQDVGFYLFSLPFYDSIYWLFMLSSAVALIAALVVSFTRFRENNIFLYFPYEIEINSAGWSSPLFLTSSVFVLALAVGRYLERYHLMFSSTGVVAGPGWTDVNILLPAYAVVIVLLVIIGLLLLVPYTRRKAGEFYSRKFRKFSDRPYIGVLAVPAILIAAIWIIAFGALPQIFQWLVVEPNEITFERPYIQNNIKFTRMAFGLDNMEEKEYPLTGSFTQQTVQNNPNIFNNVRLWDWKALDAVYRQFQSIRLYYEFSDVDVDRYNIDGKMRQVMVSGREINLDNLPPQSQTFVNKRFQYTHGYGITMAAVNEFTEQGLPHLLIKDIPPVSESPSLKVSQPQIYFGEETNSPVVVNTKAKEFDYPSGEDNVYTKYSGKGGVELSNFWRKFLYGWKFDGTNFLFSDYPTTQSRLMFHRQVQERVKLLAPFLNFDKDAYIVLANGRLYWMLDAYTTSGNYPYSQPFSAQENIPYKEGNETRNLTTDFSSYLEGANYIRNSVKAVVDAYDGTVNFYIMDKKDPIIKVWSKIFPHLFKSREEMPKEILNHLRYPMEMLLTQGIVYAKYHMTDPTVFYNQEDLWVRATAKYYNEVQPVDPYYIMWQVPGSDKQQFVLMLPFTPKNRQVLIGWIAGMCDPENYGRFISYQFPKDQTVLGPQQVETKIDQDSYLSGQLTLWDQHGSKVIRGNVLAIPVNNTLFYVEPIYLQAETAAYPELRLVVVMHQENMSYAKTFEEALGGLFSRSPQPPPAETASSGTKPPAAQQQAPNMQAQIKTANDAFNNYLRLQGEKKFPEAARELERLQQTLQTLSNQAK